MNGRDFNKRVIFVTMSFHSKDDPQKKVNIVVRFCS